MEKLESFSGTKATSSLKKKYQNRLWEKMLQTLIIEMGFVRGCDWAFIRRFWIWGGVIKESPVFNYRDDLHCKHLCQHIYVGIIFQSISNICKCWRLCFVNVCTQIKPYIIICVYFAILETYVCVILFLCLLFTTIRKTA